MLNDARLLADDAPVRRGAGFDHGAANWRHRLSAGRGQVHSPRQPPDDKVLLAGLSDDQAQRQPTTIEYVDYLNRFEPLEETLRANGQWSFPHPWLMTFIGDSQVESVVEAELEELNPASDLGPFGQIVLSPIRRSAFSSPLLRTTCVTPSTSSACPRPAMPRKPTGSWRPTRPPTSGSRLRAAPSTRSVRSPVQARVARPLRPSLRPAGRRQASTRPEQRPHARLPDLLADGVNCCNERVTD